MSKHLSDKDIERYCEHAMSPAELLAADDHLAVCDACYGRIDHREIDDSFTHVEAALQEAADIEPNHLSYEQLTSCVDQRLTEAESEILNTHLQICSRCETELKELRSFKATMAAYPEKTYAPASTPTTSNKRTAFWRLPAYRIPIQLAAAAAAIAIFFTIATLPLRREVANLKAQVSELQHDKEALLGEAQTARELQTQLSDIRQENERLRREFDEATQVVVALNDGDTRVTLDNQGNLSGLNSLPAAHQQLARRALTAGQVKTPALLAQLIGKQGKLMGGSEGRASYGLISPVATVAGTDRPSFHWRPQSGAGSYEVTIFDSRSKKVASSGPVSGSEWTVPASLDRGRIYSWQVRTVIEAKEVVLPPPAAPDAKFKVLEQAKADELERARQTAGNSHLILGILYAEAGLLDDSEREFRALVNANQQSSIAQKLLRSVTSQRRTK